MSIETPAFTPQPKIDRLFQLSEQKGWEDIPVRWNNLEGTLRMQGVPNKTRIARVEFPDVLLNLSLFHEPGEEEQITRTFEDPAGGIRKHIPISSGDMKKVNVILDNLQVAPQSATAEQ